MNYRAYAIFGPGGLFPSGGGGGGVNVDPRTGRPAPSGPTAGQHPSRSSGGGQPSGPNAGDKHSGGSRPSKHTSSSGGAGCFAAGGEILSGSQCDKLGIPRGTQSQTIGAQGQRITPAQGSGPPSLTGIVGMQNQAAVVLPGGEIAATPAYATAYAIRYGKQYPGTVAFKDPKTGQFYVWDPVAGRYFPYSQVIRNRFLNEPTSGGALASIVPQYESISLLADVYHTTPDMLLMILSGLSTAPKISRTWDLLTAWKAFFGHSGLAMTYPETESYGFQQSFTIASDNGKQTISFGGNSIYTQGIYGGGSSAEILVLSNPPGQANDQATLNPAGNFLAHIIIGLNHGNVNPAAETDGFYATPMGISSHMFKTQPIAGHHYTSKIVSRGLFGTTYILQDDTSGAPPEMWTDTSYLDNIGFALSRKKQIRSGLEWHTTSFGRPATIPAGVGVRYNIFAERPSYLGRGGGGVIDSGTPVAFSFNDGTFLGIPRGCGPGTDNSRCCDPRRNPNCGSGERLR